MSESQKSVEKKPVNDQESQDSLDVLKDHISGLAPEERRSLGEFINEFIHGRGHDRDPLRRWVREHGGHCSGGEGPC